MEFFVDGQFVRLRSRVHGTYLFADEDGRGVSLSERRASQNAAWAVQVFHGDGAEYVLLRGAAYGRYLAATGAPAPPSHRGFAAAQGEFHQPEVDAIMWQAVRRGDGVVLLRNVDGRYLRANGRYLLWKKGVTVDEHANVSTMMEWVVQVIPLRQNRPTLPAPLPAPTGLGGLRFRPPVGREIRYVVANADGIFSEQDWNTIQFTSRSVFRLRNTIAFEMGHPLQFFVMTLCTRAGRFGQLTPLVVNLPLSNDPIDIVVVTAGTRADDELRYPNVDQA